MAKITAQGVPAKYPEFGQIRIIIEGTDVEIQKTSFELYMKSKDKWIPMSFLEDVFNDDMERGPHYPLCAEPETMRRALFILYEWFGEDKSCWVEEPKHVIVEGEIEPMESEPGVIY